MYVYKYVYKHMYIYTLTINGSTEVLARGPLFFLATRPHFRTVHSSHLFFSHRSNYLWRLLKALPKGFWKAFRSPLTINGSSKALAREPLFFLATRAHSLTGDLPHLFLITFQSLVKVSKLHFKVLITLKGFPTFKFIWRFSNYFWFFKKPFDHQRL